MSRRFHLLVLTLLVMLVALPASPVLAHSDDPPDAASGVFVRVEDGLDAAALVRAHAPDVKVVREYPRISAAFVTGPAASLGRLPAVDGVVHVQEDRALEWLGDTSSWATRVRVVQEFAPGGSGLIGSGVGVAIVDSGANAAHPDLRNRVAHNYTYVCTTPGLISTTTGTCYGNSVVDQANGDPTPTFGMVDMGDTNGHGTLVAGVIAGDGTMSTGDYPPGTGPNMKGTFTGVAPGATIYSYGTGGVISVFHAVEALHHILVYGNTFSPRISVVNNSWGTPGGTPFDPNDIVNRLVDKLVDDNGVTVVFPAGNGGGSGFTDMTSGYCKNPKAGVICVANYDDGGTGGRNGTVDSSSSRGKSGDSTTATFPDVSAPGTFITSTCIQVVQPLCTSGETRWPHWYSTFSGSSAAAAHVSGIVALLLQFDPSLSPAAVEDLLQDSAYKLTSGATYVSDPQNPGSGDTTSYDKGAGLVDAKAALHAAGLPQWTPIAPDNLVLAGGDGGDFTYGAADIVSLDVTQTTGSSGAAGFRYDITVADALDFGPGGDTVTVVYRLHQIAGGVPSTIDVVAATFAAGSPLGSPAQDVTRVSNTVSFFVPFTALGGFGGLPAGEAAHHVRVVSFYGTGARPMVDVAPSGEPAAVAFSVRPMLGRPYMRA